MVGLVASDGGRMFTASLAISAPGQRRDFVGLVEEEPLQDPEAAMPGTELRENRHVGIRPIIAGARAEAFVGGP